MSSNPNSTDLQIWEQLHEARQSCEHMTMRGVRAAKDVMTGWAGIVQDLMERAQQQALIIEELQLAASTRDMPSLLSPSTRGHSSNACRGFSESSCAAGGFSGNSCAAGGFSGSSCAVGGRPAVGLSSGGPQHSATAATVVAAGGLTPAQPHLSGEGAGRPRGGNNSSRRFEQRGQQGDDAVQVLLLRLEEAERERAQLEATNGELAQSLESMTLLFSSVSVAVEWPQRKEAGGAEPGTVALSFSQPSAR